MDQVASVKRSDRLIIGIMLWSALIGGGILLYCIDPLSPAGRFYPKCLWKSLTGLECAGCGMTRAAHALLHGRWAEAFRDNMLIYPVAAVGIYVLTEQSVRMLAGRKVLPQLKMPWYGFAALAALCIAFMIWRNGT